MTRVVIYTEGDSFRGFECRGHSGYADRGEDIVCAGISALTITTINALDLLTDQTFSLKTDEKSGHMRLMLDKTAEHDAKLLIESMILGLKGILRDYGNKVISIEYKEV
jgi:uncharacterized protein YsxB (DUF464 family)